MINKTVVILARDGAATRLLIQVVSKHYSNVHVVFENASSRMETMKRRANKIGWMKVLGQIAFLLLIAPFIKNSNRIKAIIAGSGYDLNPSLKDAPTQLNSVNERASIEKIKSLSPDIIYVNGTRILSKEFLKNIPVPIINIHVGITPKYRGIHGGYWAVKNNDLGNFGTTIHHVDAGIDTGAIIEQVYPTITRADNYSSYSMLQYVAALEKLDALIENNPQYYLKTKDQPDLPSELHYHPTIWQYLF